MTYHLAETIDTYEALLQAASDIELFYQKLYALANKKVVTDMTTQLSTDLQKAIENCRRDAQFNLKNLYLEKAMREKSDC